MNSADSNNWTQIVQQMSQLVDFISLLRLSNNLLQLSGLLSHTNTPERKQQAKVTLSRDDPKPLAAPVVTPTTLSDIEVHAQTGFASLMLLLSFIVVVCNGNITMMMQQEKLLTWFEEWFLYFQWEWGWESTTLPLLEISFKLSSTTGNPMHASVERRWH